MVYLYSSTSNFRCYPFYGHDVIKPFRSLDFLLNFRKSSRQNKNGPLNKRQNYQISKYSTNTLGFPFVLYTATLGTTSNSTNVHTLQKRKKKASRRKLKSNEGNKNKLSKSRNKIHVYPRI